MVRTVDIPQANDLRTVRAVVRAVALGSNSRDEVADFTGFSVRHTAYRLHAARALGWVSYEREQARLLPAGERLLASARGSDEERQRWYEATQRSAVVQQLVPDLLAPMGPELEAVTQALRDGSRLGFATAERRAQGLLRWREQVLNLSPLRPMIRRRVMKPGRKVHAPKARVNKPAKIGTPRLKRSPRRGPAKTTTTAVISAISQATPAISQATSAISQATPAISQATPAHRTTPRGHGPVDRAPIAEAPSFTEEVPSFAEEPPSFAEEPPSFAEEPPSFAEEPPSFAEEPPSFAEEPPSFTEEAQSSAQEAPSSAQEAPSFAEEAQSPAQEAPSSAQEAPSFAEGAANTTNGVSKAIDDAPLTPPPAQAAAPAPVRRRRRRVRAGCLGEQLRLVFPEPLDLPEPGKR